jgi:hypothetical protein
MNRVAVSFVSSMGVLLPAAWSTIAADRGDVTALTRPGSPSLAVDDDTTVTVTSDKTLYAPGETVNATLVAISSHPHQVTVDFSVTQQQNWPGSRVGDPDKTIAHNHITLDAKPGGGPAKYLGVPVAGWQLSDGTDPLARWAGAARTYSIHLAKVDSDPEDYEHMALLNVVTENPSAYALTIHAPEKITPGEEFAASVTVKNTSTKPLSNVSVQLAAAPDSVSPGFESPINAGDSDKLTITPDTDDDNIVKLAPGESKTVKFKVTAQAGAPGLYAWASATYGGTAMDMKRLSLPPAPTPPTDNTVASK